MNLLNILGIGNNTGSIGEINERAHALEESVTDFVSTLTTTRDDIDGTATEISDIVSSLNMRLSGLKRAQKVLDNVITLIDNK